MKRGKLARRALIGISCKTAQVSVEYLLVVGFAMLMIIPIVLLFFQQTNDLSNSLSLNQARNIAVKITETAESVYYQGYPAQSTLTVYFPEKINSVTVSEREVNFEMEVGAGLSDVYSVSSVNLTGQLTPSSGVKRIKIKATGTVVNITEEI